MTMWTPGSGLVVVALWTTTVLTACRATPVGLTPIALPAEEAVPDGVTRSRVAFTHALPPLDGNRLEVKVVEVVYGPGASSAPHSHPCAVVGYVVAGAVTMRIRGEPEATYRAGESFYEAPGGVHVISANASQKQPARFIASFTCDRATPLSVPAADSSHLRR